MLFLHVVESLLLQSRKCYTFNNSPRLRRAVDIKKLQATSRLVFVSACRYLDGLVKPNTSVFTVYLLQLVLVDIRSSRT